MKKSIDKYIYNLIIFLIIWILFQDFALSIFYNITNLKGLTKILFYSKDAILIVLFIASIIINRKEILFNKLKNFIAIIIYLFLCGIYALLSIKNGIGIESIGASFRGIILLPILITIGINAKRYDEFKPTIINVFFPMLILFSILGLIDYWLIPSKFWTNIVGIGRFMTDIKDQGNRLVSGLPGNFFGDYGKGYFSQKRLVSLWGGPLTAAYLLNIPFLYYFIELWNNNNKKTIIKNLIIVFLLFASIVLTHTRAIILLDIVFIIIFIFIKLRRYGYKIIILMSTMGIAIIAVNLKSILAKIYDGSTIGHINSILNSIVNIGFFGKGIGTFGVWSNMSTENSYITLWGQIGLVGLILYLVIWFLNFKGVYMTLDKDLNKIDSLALTILVSSVIYFITGFASEQIFAFTTIAPYYLLLGYLSDFFYREYHS